MFWLGRFWQVIELDEIIQHIKGNSNPDNNIDWRRKAVNVLPSAHGAEQNGHLHDDGDGHQDAVPDFSAFNDVKQTTVPWADKGRSNDGG